ncbi:hypothetical protein D3C87_1419980 [compost metagenome]
MFIVFIFVEFLKNMIIGILSQKQCKQNRILKSILFCLTIEYVKLIEVKAKKDRSVYKQNDLF